MALLAYSMSRKHSIFGSENEPNRNPIRLILESLADAEAAEDFAEQVIGGEFAGDLVESVLGLA